MDCRSAQRLISAERDGALSQGERASLQAHVETCNACARARADLAAAADAWRTANSAVAVPDAERAWQNVRREIRRRAGGGQRTGWGWWPRILLGGVPALGAAALAAFVWMRPTQPPVDLAASGPASWARFVEVDATAGTPVVIVDEASGWVVVWAGEDAGDGQT